MLLTPIEVELRPSGSPQGLGTSCFLFCPSSSASGVLLLLICYRSMSSYIDLQPECQVDSYLCTIIPAPHPTYLTLIGWVTKIAVLSPESNWLSSWWNSWPGIGIGFWVMEGTQLSCHLVEVNCSPTQTQVSCVHWQEFPELVRILPAARVGLVGDRSCHHGDPALVTVGIILADETSFLQPEITSLYWTSAQC